MGQRTSSSEISLFAAVPALAMLRLARIVENSLDYSLQNRVQQALFFANLP